MVNFKTSTINKLLHLITKSSACCFKIYHPQAFAGLIKQVSKIKNRCQYVDSIRHKRRLITAFWRKISIWLMQHLLIHILCKIFIQKSRIYHTKTNERRQRHYPLHTESAIVLSRISNFRQNVRLE